MDPLDRLLQQVRSEVQVEPPAPPVAPESRPQKDAVPLEDLEDPRLKALLGSVKDERTPSSADAIDAQVPPASSGWTQPVDDARLEDLLKQAGVEAVRPPVAGASGNTSAATPPAAPATDAQLDALLSQVKKDLQPPAPRPAAASPPAPVSTASPPAPEPSSPAMDQVLQKAAAEIERQAQFERQQAELERRRQEHQEQLRRAAQKAQLEKEARTFLANLKPFSDEGYWFNRFAADYPTPLEAAVEYLAMLRQQKS